MDVQESHWLAAFFLHPSFPYFCVARFSIRQCHATILQHKASLIPVKVTALGRQYKSTLLVSINDDDATSSRLSRANPLFISFQQGSVNIMTLVSCEPAP